MYRLGLGEGLGLWGSERKKGGVEEWRNGRTGESEEGASDEERIGE